MKKFKTILMLTAIISLTAIGCKKGDTGPIGPAGTNGVDGINGANGANGVNGAAGNTNVYNYKFNVNLSSFSGPLSNGEWSSTNSLTFMGNTYIDEKDAVLLYLFDHAINGTNYYNALPYIDYFNPGTSFNQHSFQIGSTGLANILILKIRNSTGGQPYTSMTTGALSYKMVLVKASARIANPNVNYNDYNAVKKAFHLKD